MALGCFRCHFPQISILSLSQRTNIDWLAASRKESTRIEGLSIHFPQELTRLGLNVPIRQNELTVSLFYIIIKHVLLPQKMHLVDICFLIKLLKVFRQVISDAL